MDPTFGHPLWIFVGAVLVLVGLWLFLWATGRSASATEQGKLRGTLQAPQKPAQCAVNGDYECDAEQDGEQLPPRHVSAFRDHRLLDDHSRTDGRRARGVLSRRIVRCSAGAQRPHCERNAPATIPTPWPGLTRPSRAKDANVRTSCSGWPPPRAAMTWRGIVTPPSASSKPRPRFRSWHKRSARRRRLRARQAFS